MTATTRRIFGIAQADSIAIQNIKDRQFLICYLFSRKSTLSETYGLRSEEVDALRSCPGAQI